MFFRISMKPEELDRVDAKCGLETAIKIFNLFFFTIETRQELYDIEEILERLIYEKLKIGVGTLSGVEKLFPSHLPDFETDLHQHLASDRALPSIVRREHSMAAIDSELKVMNGDNPTACVNRLLLSDEEFEKIWTLAIKHVKHSSQTIEMLCNDLFKHSSYIKINRI